MSALLQLLPAQGSPTLWESADDPAMAFAPAAADAIDPLAPNPFWFPDEPCSKADGALLPAKPLAPVPLKVYELELELELALDEAKLDEDDFEKLPENPLPLGILSGMGTANAPDAAFASAKNKIKTLGLMIAYNKHTIKLPKGQCC